MDKIKYLSTEFFKIFFVYLGIRFLLVLLNNKPLDFQDILKNHVPMAALFAGVYALIRFFLIPKK
jgi:hypothetical protein